VFGLAIARMLPVILHTISATTVTSSKLYKV